MVVSDPSVAKKILKLIEKIEEDDDVNQVHSNVDFSEEVMSQLA